MPLIAMFVLICLTTATALLLMFAEHAAACTGPARAWWVRATDRVAADVSKRLDTWAAKRLAEKARVSRMRNAKAGTAKPTKAPRADWRKRALDAEAREIALNAHLHALKQQLANRAAIERALAHTYA